MANAGNERTELPAEFESLEEAGIFWDTHSSADYEAIMVPVNVIQAIDLIATNPRVRSGRPFIVGTSITVADIAVAKIFMMMHAEEIADSYRLTLPQVECALAYYDEHKAEIDQDLSNRRQLAQEMKEKRAGSRHSPRLE